jgi:hypothetical protein
LRPIPTKKVCDIYDQLKRDILVILSAKKHVLPQHRTKTELNNSNRERMIQQSFSNKTKTKDPGNNGMLFRDRVAASGIKTTNKSKPNNNSKGGGNGSKKAPAKKAPKQKKTAAEKKAAAALRKAAKLEKAAKAAAVAAEKAAAIAKAEKNLSDKGVSKKRTGSNLDQPSNKRTKVDYGVDLSNIEPTNVFEE